MSASSSSAEDKEDNKKDNKDKVIDVESSPAPVVSTPQNPRMQFYADKLEDKAGDTTFKNYEKLLVLDEYQMDGITLKAKKLKPKEIGELRKLTIEIPKINQETEFDRYLVNMKAQGKLLIQDLTDEIFDNSDFYVLENLIVAWRMKHRGFREL